MLEYTEFERLVRDALADLYDWAALETHPLTSLFVKPAEQQGSRGEFLHAVLLAAIESLRPTGRGSSPASTEWRPYQILYARYVEGLSLSAVEARLALSSRQLRREHGRALRAVAALLWEQAFPGVEFEPPEDQLTRLGGESGPATFEITYEPLDLGEIVSGVEKTLRNRIQSEGAELLLSFPAELPPVRADRVILRQILLSLISHALHLRTGGDLNIAAEPQGEQVALGIQFHSDNPPLDIAREADDGLSLQDVAYWAQRLDATLQELPDAAIPAGSTRLVLTLPRADQSIILVVDDQEAAIRMFRRCLAHMPVRVVGVREPEQVMPLARQLQPRAILLDVMMPTIDGWELLQTLQADPETSHIPIIVCSVWKEPELAFSLGAAEFLKKPITQRDLLAVLARLKLVDMPAESSPIDT